MSVGSVGAQALGALVAKSGATQASASNGAIKAPGAEKTGDRFRTPEEDEKLKKNLASLANTKFNDVLKQHAERTATARAEQGLSPNGVVVNISA